MRIRINCSEEEDFAGHFELWQANCRRSLKGKKGQSALRELEAALLALPEKRLIANKLQDRQGEVCALGALAKYKNHEMAVAETTEDDEWDDEWDYDIDGSMEEFGVSLGMPRMVAWKVVALNDIELEGLSPESRYERVLAWTQRQISTQQ